MSKWIPKAMGEGRARAELFSSLLDEVALTAFRLQAGGERPGGGIPAGQLAILTALEAEGPATVAALARRREVARQGVQRNADALARAGLVAWAENPRHKRAKLLELTPRGRRAGSRARSTSLAWAAWIDDSGQGDAALRSAARVLRWCRARLSTD